MVRASPNYISREGRTRTRPGVSWSRRGPFCWNTRAGPWKREDHEWWSTAHFDVKLEDLVGFAAEARELYQQLSRATGADRLSRA